METNPAGRDSFGLFVISAMGELQARMLRFPEKRAALSAAWAQLHLRAGCVALIARMRQNAWVSCGVYGLSGSHLTQMSQHRQHGPVRSMDVNGVAPGLHAAASWQTTMDII